MYFGNPSLATEDNWKKKNKTPKWGYSPWNGGHTAAKMMKGM